jgi:formylglycine-generating enzyme required for sulfatase activity
VQALRAADQPRIREHLGDRFAAVLALAEKAESAYRAEDFETAREGFGKAQALLKPLDEIAAAIERGAKEAPGWPSEWRLPPRVRLKRTEGGIQIYQFDGGPGGDESEMVLVLGGRFPYQGPNTDAGEASAVPAFLMDRFEVTTERFARFLNSYREVGRLRFWNMEDHDRPDQPVVGVSLEQARLFVKWAGNELPNVVEWELAACWDARKRRRRPYPWGVSAPNQATVQVPPLVTDNPADISPWGVRRMGTGVREWCELRQPLVGWGALRGGSEMDVGRIEATGPLGYIRSTSGSQSADAGFRCILRLTPTWTGPLPR